MTITYIIGGGLYVNVTNRCTNRCDFCIRKNGSSAYGSGNLWLEREPDVDEITADIEKHDLSRFEELVFCGYGEPAMRLYDILEVIRRVRQKSGIKVRINTNGQADLIYSKPTAHLLKGLVDTVSISLNESDAARYDRVCHSIYGAAAYPAVIAYAVDCLKYVPRVVFTVVDVIPPQEIEKCRLTALGAGVEFRVRKMIKK